MDKFKQFGKEYEELKQSVSDYLQKNPDEFEFYVETALLRIWSSNARYSEDYAKAVRAISGKSRSGQEILKAMTASLDADTANQIPQFFADMTADDFENASGKTKKFTEGFRSLLVGGACINGDFTIEESNAVTAEVRKLMTYALSKGVKIGYATGRNREKITPLKEESYVAGTASAAGFDLDMLFDVMDQTFLRPAQMKRDELNGDLFSGLLSGAAENAGGGAVKDPYAGTAEDAGGAPGADAPQGEASGEAQEAQEQEQEQEAAVDERTMEELMAELDSLVGLASIKEDIHSLMNFIRITQIRKERGMNVPTISYHLVFTGNPGTGKTTVARLVAGLYARIGILPKGQLVEVDRGQLVAGYTGQTAIKTMDVIKKALGGVLFIDEAYALVNDDQDSFGKEAVETILKAMEDHRDELVVIVAGYTELMHKFIESNPGFKSRFSKFFEFPDYTGEELMQIFRRFCDSNGYTLGEGAEELLREKFQEMYESRSRHFGNGRTVRNVFEKAIHQQANRLSSGADGVTDEDLQELTVSDLTAALESESGKFRATDE